MAELSEQPEDPRHRPVRKAIITITDDIIDGWMQGGCWPNSGDQCEFTNRILAALDEVK